MSNGSIGLSGRTFDAFVSSQRAHNEPDWAAKIQEKYWRARQKFLAKIEKNEDSCIVLSDSKLDAKLEIYHSIDDSCSRLTNILENYQNSLFMFANEENALGILLKECGKHDKTKAGKIMSITGRGLTTSSHQRIRLYMPLLRMFQEMETFHSRAVEDTANTVDKLENTRSQYRASLLWMKDISEKLNPDIYKQLDRFRRVQAKVREDKKVFDGMQMDVVQKIDLLMASRCNLMNQILASYQAILQETFEKNCNNFKSIADLIKNEDIYEYEFKALKQLNPLKVTDDVIKPEEGKPKTSTSHESKEADLLGVDGAVEDGSVDSPSTLIDVSQEGANELSSEEARKEQVEAIDLLESLFGNKESNVSLVDDCSELRQTDTTKEKKHMQQCDLKALMSKFDTNLFQDETDEDKQIASLLGPSENLQMKSGQQFEETPTRSVNDDIFDRWARDADINLLNDEKHTDSVPSEVPISDKSEDDKDQNKSVNLMDIDSPASGSTKNQTHFYA